MALNAAQFTYPGRGLFATCLRTCFYIHIDDSQHTKFHGGLDSNFPCDVGNQGEHTVGSKRWAMVGTQDLLEVWCPCDLAVLTCVQLYQSQFGWLLGVCHATSAGFMAALPRTGYLKGAVCHACDCQAHAYARVTYMHVWCWMIQWSSVTQIRF